MVSISGPDKENLGISSCGAAIPRERGSRNARFECRAWSVRNSGAFLLGLAPTSSVSGCRFRFERPAGRNDDAEVARHHTASIAGQRANSEWRDRAGLVDPDIFVQRD